MKIFLIIAACCCSLLSKAGNADSLIAAHAKGKKDTVWANKLFLDVKALRDGGKYSDARILLFAFRNTVNGKIKSKRHKALWLMHMGLTNDYEGYYDSAVNYYRKSIVIFNAIGDKYHEANTYLNMGIAYIYKGDNKNSLKNYLKALDLAEKHKFEFMAKTIRINLAGIYFNMGDYKKAEAQFRHRINGELKRVPNEDKAALASSYYNIAMINIKWVRIDSAEFYLLKAYEYASAINDKIFMADSKAGLGMVRRHQGRYADAIKEYNEFLRIMRETDAVVSYENYLNLSLLYSFLKDREKSIAYSDTAMMVVNRSNSAERRAKAFHSRAQVFNQLGEYKKAFDALFSYTLINDSLFSDENEKEIANMKIEFDKRKNADSIRLHEKIVREQQKVKLEAEAAEQDRRNKTILYGVLAFSVLIIVFSLFLYRRFQITKKQNKIIELQKKEVMLQKELVEEKNKEIVDSINYAKRLQDAILPSDANWRAVFPESFILYRPKDIVAGDFYWMDVIEKNTTRLVLFAAADCTGHGVPGAMVSVVCSNALNRSVNEFGLTEPGKVLDKTTELVIETFIKSGSEVKDGMDVSLCTLDLNTGKLLWSGANNPLWVLRNGEMMQIKADKQPVGMYVDRKNFTTHQVDLESGDIIYIFSDGYADQFGGERKKKFKESSLRTLLTEVGHLPMEHQRKKVEEAFLNWKGNLEQIDDVCIIGIKIK